MLSLVDPLPNFESAQDSTVTTSLIWSTLRKIVFIERYLPREQNEKQVVCCLLRVLKLELERNVMNEAQHACRLACTLVIFLARRHLCDDRRWWPNQCPN